MFAQGVSTIINFVVNESKVSACEILNEENYLFYQGTRFARIIYPHP